MRSVVANRCARIGDDRRPAEKLRGAAERLGRVDCAVVRAVERAAAKTSAKNDVPS